MLDVRKDTYVGSSFCLFFLSWSILDFMYLFLFFFFFPFLLIFFYLTLLNLHFLCNVFFEQRSFPLPTRGQVWPSLPHCASLTMQECTVVSSRVSWCRTRHWAFLRSRLRAEKPFYWLHWSLNLRSNPVGPGYKTVNSR